MFLKSMDKSCSIILNVMDQGWLFSFGFGRLMIVVGMVKIGEIVFFLQDCPRFPSMISIIKLI